LSIKLSKSVPKAGREKRRQGKPGLESENVHWKEHFDVNGKGDILPKRSLRPAHLQKLQSILGNRDMVQGMRPKTPVIQCNRLDDIGVWISGTAGAMDNAVTEVGGEVNDLAHRGGEWLWNYGAGRVENNWNAVTGMADRVGQVASFGSDLLQNAGSRGLEAIGGPAGQAADMVSGGADRLWNTAAGGVDTVRDALSSAAGQAANFFSGETER